MATKSFSKREAINFGWTATKNNFWFWVVLLVIIILISNIPDIITKFIPESYIQKIITDILRLTLQTLIAMWLIKVSLKFIDNLKVTFGDFFLPLFSKYFVASLLYGLIVLGGLILFIVPGIFWAIKYQFFGYFIIDKGLNPIDALKKSSVITKGVEGDLFLFDLLLMFINLLGAICLLIGLFATIPTTQIAMAFVYRKLLTQSELQS